MKLTEDFDKLIATYKQLLQQCHDALDPATPQRTRNDLRAALGKFIQTESRSAKPGNGSGGGQ